VERRKEEKNIINAAALETSPVTSGRVDTYLD